MARARRHRRHYRRRVVTRRARARSVPGRCSTTPSRTTCGRSRAARRGSRRSLRRLLYDGIAISRVDAHGRTPLHVAYACGALRCALLLEQAAADQHALDHDGKQPHELLTTDSLVAAARRDDLDDVRLLTHFMLRFECERARNHHASPASFAAIGFAKVVGVRARSQHPSSEGRKDTARRRQPRASAGGGSAHDLLGRTTTYFWLHEPEIELEYDPGVVKKLASEGLWDSLAAFLGAVHALRNNPDEDLGSLLQNHPDEDLDATRKLPNEFGSLLRLDELDLSTAT